MAIEKLRFGRLSEKRDKGQQKGVIQPEIIEGQRGTKDAVRETVEAIDPQQEIKGLLCEMYDKVNVAAVLYKGQRERGSETPVSFKLERFKMLKRYLRELHQLGATQKDYAKFIAMWHGDIDVKRLGEYETLARDLKIALDLDLGLDSIMQGMDSMKVLSAPEDFQNATEAQWGLYPENSSTVEFSIRRGYPMTFAVYSKLKNYVALDPEHRVHSGKLVMRSAGELAELSDSYKGYGHDGYMTSGLFEKTAAVLLYMYKSSFVNAFNDRYVRKICRMVLEGTTKERFHAELIQLRPIPD